MFRIIGAEVLRDGEKGAFGVAGLKEGVRACNAESNAKSHGT